jgi:hypothetical protein
MTDIRSDMELGAQEHQGAPDEHEGKHAPQRNTTEEPIQVLVLSPDGAPRLQTIENHLDALEALLGGPIGTFSTGVESTIGVSNVEAAGLSVLPDVAIHGTGMSISGTFIVAGEADDGTSLQSISPLQLEQALERLAPTLSFAQFEQIIRSHPLGPEWIANWKPPEL